MSKQRGLLAEQEVAHFLEKQSYTIIARNYHSAWGEIDIIVKQNNVLAFVEVKMRGSVYFDLSELITKSKQHKIVKTAKQFLASGDWSSYDCRFDVALLEGLHTVPIYIPNAFTSDGF